jgi:hypothetical protein
MFGGLYPGSSYPGAGGPTGGGAALAASPSFGVSTTASLSPGSALLAASPGIRVGVSATLFGAAALAASPGIRVGLSASLTATATFAASPGIRFSIAATFGAAALGASPGIRFSTTASLTTGVEALHASRISLLLAGVEARVRVSGLVIRDILNDAPNICSLTIDGSETPVTAQSLRVSLNLDAPRLLFSGALQQVGLSYEGQPNQLVWPASAIDDTPRANRRRPFGTWTTVSATTVVQSLVAVFAPGFTATHVQLGLPTISIILDGSEGMNGALRQITDLIGGWFFWDDGDLWLFNDPAFLGTDLPDDIDATAGRFLDDPKISAVVDDSQLRTRVFGKGHGEVVTTDVLAGAAVVPIENAVTFNPLGGLAIAGTTPDSGQSQRLAYTGLGLGDPLQPTWIAQTPATLGVSWTCVVWADALGLFVAIASGSSAVMTSPDGVNWTARTAAEGNPWVDVTWAPSLSLLVAVALSGTHQVMTSPDGITWTARTAAAAKAWAGVAWAPSLGLFVAVAVSSANTSAVMTSPDGVTWTLQTASSVSDWRSVTWAPALNLFVAVSGSGTTASVMTSPDGVTWTGRTAASALSWRSVTWAPALSLFVAVSDSVGTTNVMTSPDGTTWTTRTTPGGGLWARVLWAAELHTFVIVQIAATGAVATSPDGVTWTLWAIPAVGRWQAVAWSTRGRLVVLGNTSGDIFAMTNGYNALAGVTGLVLPIQTGAMVHIWVQRDDLPAQAAQAVIDAANGIVPADGVYEAPPITDERRGEASLIALCDATLARYSRPLVTVTYACRPPSDRPFPKSGRPITIDLVSPPIHQTLTIQEVQIDQIDVSPGTMPRFSVVASSVRQSLDGLLRKLLAAAAA